MWWYGSTGTTNTISTQKIACTSVSLYPDTPLLTLAEAQAYDIPGRICAVSVQIYPYSINPSASSGASVIPNKDSVQFRIAQVLVDNVEASDLIDTNTFTYRPEDTSRFLLTPSTHGYTLDRAWMRYHSWPWVHEGHGDLKVPYSFAHSFSYSNLGTGNTVSRVVFYEIQYIVEYKFLSGTSGLPSWYNESVSVQSTLNKRGIDLVLNMTIPEVDDLTAYYDHLNHMIRKFNQSPKFVRKSIFPGSTDPYIPEVFTPEQFGIENEDDYDTCDI